MASAHDTTAPRPAPAKPRKRQTADERREQVLKAARSVIAREGMHGASTAEIARDAGISHAYLFRLFPTKDDLLLAVAVESSKRLHDEMISAGEGAKASGEDPLAAMAVAFSELLLDREQLRVQLHAITASAGIAALGEQQRASWGQMVEDIARVSGADDDQLRGFIAQGMLLQVIAALGAEEADWVVRLHGGPMPCAVENATDPEFVARIHKNSTPSTIDKSSVAPKLG